MQRSTVAAFGIHGKRTGSETASSQDTSIAQFDTYGRRAGSETDGAGNGLPSAEFRFKGRVKTAARLPVSTTLLRFPGVSHGLRRR